MLRNLNLRPERRAGVFLVLAASTVLKLLLAVPDRIINRDGVLYIAAAKAFASGDFSEGMERVSMPLYSLAIALIHGIVPDWVAAGKGISIISAILAVVPLYLLTESLYGRRAAFWGSLAFAVAPLPNDWAHEIIRDPPYLLFFGWAVYFAHRAVQSKRVPDYLAGIFLACLSALFRIEGIILIPVYGLFLTGRALFGRDEAAGLIKGVVIWIAFPLLLLSAVYVGYGADWMLFNRFYSVADFAGRIITMDFFDNYRRIYEHLKALEAASPYPGGKENFAETARHLMPFIYLWGLFRLFVKALFPLFVIPLVWAMRNQRETLRTFPFVLTVFYLLLLLASHIKEDFLEYRFFLAPAWLLFPWVGAGMDRIWTRLRERAGRRILQALFVILFVVVPVAKTITGFTGQDDTARKAGRWLSENRMVEGNGILTSEIRIPFYAGAEEESLVRPLNERTGRYDAKEMEREAVEARKDLLIIMVSKKDLDRLDPPETYDVLKIFRGEKNAAIVYASPDFTETLRARGGILPNSKGVP